jgi:hypothetical protein
MKSLIALLAGVLLLITACTCASAQALTQKQKTFINNLDNFFLEKLEIDVKVTSEKRDGKLWLVCRHPIFGNRVNLRKMEDFLIKLANDAKCAGFDAFCFYWDPNERMNCYQGDSSGCK